MKTIQPFDYQIDIKSNRNEGSIPFTRSIDNQRLAKKCK
jgi:hypothetical protein